MCDLAWLDLSDQIQHHVDLGGQAALMAAANGRHTDPPDYYQALDDMWTLLCDPRMGEQPQDARVQVLLAGLT